MTRYVIVVYFEDDGEPALEFHIPDDPSTLKLDLPQVILDDGSWDESYKTYSVSFSYLDIELSDLMPLCEESKKHGC